MWAQDNTVGRVFGANGIGNDPLNEIERVMNHVREFHDWTWDETRTWPTPNAPVFQNYPANRYNYPLDGNGQNSFVQYYNQMKGRGIDVLATLKVCHPNIIYATHNINWQQYRNGGVPRPPCTLSAGTGSFDDTRPAWPGSDFGDPDSYVWYADWAYQFASIYGRTNPTHARGYTYKYIGNPKTNETYPPALDLVQNMEIWNEPDNWWDDGISCIQSAHFQPNEYAALVSAAIDGNQGTVIAQRPHVGLQTPFPYAPGIFSADPTMGIVLSLTSDFGCDEYVNNTLQSLRDLRGGVLPPVRALSIHHYIDNFITCTGVGSSAFGSHGVSPEEGNFRTNLENEVAWINAANPELGVNGTQIWLTEYGWDTDPTSILSAYTLNSSGQRTDPEEVQARWITRAMMEASATPINRLYLYDYEDRGNGNGVFLTSGLRDGERLKRSFYYVSTLKTLLNDMVYESDVPQFQTPAGLNCASKRPFVRRFTGDFTLPNGIQVNNAVIYAYWMPTSCEVELTDQDNARVYLDSRDVLLAQSNASTNIQLQVGDFDGLYSSANSVQENLPGVFSIPVNQITERPQFLILGNLYEDGETPCNLIAQSTSLSCNSVRLNWELTTTRPISRFMVLARAATGPCGTICPPTNVTDLLADNTTRLLAANVDPARSMYVVSDLPPNTQFCFYVIPVYEDINGFETNGELCGGTVACTLPEGSFCSDDVDLLGIQTSTGGCLGQIQALFEDYNCCADVRNGVNVTSNWNPWEPGCEGVNSFIVAVDQTKGPCPILNSISLYDVQNEGLFRIEAILQDGSVIILEDYMTAAYQQWHHINVGRNDIATLRFTKVDPTANIGRITMCTTQFSCVEPVKPFPNGALDQTNVEEVKTFTRQIISNDIVKVDWPKPLLPTAGGTELIKVNNFAVFSSTHLDGLGNMHQPKLTIIESNASEDYVEALVQIENYREDSPIRVVGLVPNESCHSAPSSRVQRNSSISELKNSPYPNPAFDSWFYNPIEQDLEYDLELVTIDGKPVFAKSGLTGAFNIPANNLFAGQYILIIKSSKRTKTFQLLKLVE
jgi:hypothetical protein